MRIANSVLLPALLVFFTIQADIASSADGVIEINMARARAGGVTPSDTPGFPVTLDQPGSYRLTGNLDLRGEPLPQNVIAIRVDADDVTIDFAGFGIIGNVTCPTGPESCTPALGVGIGVWGTSQTADNLTVMNGTIRGIGRHAVQVNTGDFTRVQNMRIFESGETGLSLNDHALIRNNHIAVSAEMGLNTFSGSLLVGNTIEANDTIGARIIFGFAVGNWIRGNNSFGISQLSPYAGNILEDNNGSDPHVENGLDLKNNLCDGSATCP